LSLDLPADYFEKLQRKPPVAKYRRFVASYTHLKPIEA